MIEHIWESAPLFELVNNQAGRKVRSESLANRDERKALYCPRCRSFMTLAATGPLPDRTELGIGLVSRKITGWETCEQAMRRQNINGDCDVALVARIMES